MYHILSVVPRAPTQWIICDAFNWFRKGPGTKRMSGPCLKSETKSNWLAWCTSVSAGISVMIVGESSISALSPPPLVSYICHSNHALRNQAVYHRDAGHAMLLVTYLTDFLVLTCKCVDFVRLCVRGGRRGWRWLYMWRECKRPCICAK